jgi:hypothetical protein
MGQLLFRKCFFESIRVGTKRTTIRRWSSARLKPGSRAYAPGIGWLIIEEVKIVELSRLKDADARADGFETADEMRETLRRLYPDAEKDLDGRQWFRVCFRVEEAADEVKRASRTKRRVRKSSTADVTSQRRQLADALRHSPRMKS